MKLKSSVAKLEFPASICCSSCCYRRLESYIDSQSCSSLGQSWCPTYSQGLGEHHHCFQYLYLSLHSASFGTTEDLPATDLSSKAVARNCYYLSLELENAYRQIRAAYCILTFHCLVSLRHYMRSCLLDPALYSSRQLSHFLAH